MSVYDDMIEASPSADSTPKAVTLPPFDPTKSYGTPPKLLDNLKQTESSGNSYAINSDTKAMGPYQFMPQTIASLHQQGIKFDPFDPQQSRNAADYYIQQLAAKNGGDINKAMASYGGFVTKDPSAYVGKVMAGVLPTTSVSQPAQKSTLLDDMNSAIAAIPKAQAATTTTSPATTSSPAENNPYSPEKLAFGPSNNLTSILSGAATGFGKSALGLQQIAGKGISAVGNYFGNQNATPWEQNMLQSVGNFMNEDAIQGSNKLTASNQDYENANPKTNLAGNVAGIVASPVNKLVPGLGGPATTIVGAAGKGLVQGAIQNMITNPATDPNQSFMVEKAQQAGIGAIGGASGSGIVHSGLALGSAGLNAAKTGFNKLTGLISGDASSQAAQNTVNQTLENIGVNASTVNPQITAGLQKNVQEALNSGQPLDTAALARKAQAESLPVPIYLLRGMLTRDGMEYTKDLELAKDQSIGRPVNDALKNINDGFIQNLDAMGAKNVVNDPIAAGSSAIKTLQASDAQAKQGVADAYNAFKASTGKDLDVPLQGIAQDYANIMSKASAQTKAGIPTQLFDNLGLMSGTQKKTFNIEQAEGLIRDLNDNYISGNGPVNTVLSQLKQSVQKAITEGAGSDATGTEAQALAQQARAAAKARFDQIDATPSLSAAIKGVQPDQFIQKYVMNGNIGEIQNMMSVLQKQSPEAVTALQNQVMAMIKGAATKNRGDNTTMSENVLNNFVNDPYMSQRLEAVLGPEKMGQFRQLHDVMQNALHAPGTAFVNRSNTASAAKNLITEEIQGGNTNALLDAVNKIPGAQIISPATNAAKGAVQSGRAANLIDQTINPKLYTPRTNPLQPLAGPGQNLGQRAGSAYLNNVNQQNQQQGAQ